VAGNSTSETGSASVADAPLSAATGQSFAAVEGVAFSGKGGCQEEGEQGRVRHGGVLSRGVWAVALNPRFLGKTPPFKQKTVAQLES